MSMSGDPFTLMYVGLWQALIGHEPLASLVAVNNRLNVAEEGNTNPLAKANVSTADLPELDVRPGEWVLADHQGRVGVTNAIPITQTFTLAIRTDSLNISDRERGVNAIKWEAVRAICKLTHRSSGAQNIRYSWVESGRDVPGFRGGEDERSPEAIMGWHSLLQIRCTIWMSHAEVGLGTVTLTGNAP